MARWYIAPRKAQGSSDRAAKCGRVYDKAAKLQRDNRLGNMPSCNDTEIAKAVLQAFAGPCGKAEKQYRTALQSCKKLW
jgi:hypothetical protein